MPHYASETVTGVEMPSQGRSHYISVLRFCREPRDEQEGHQTTYDNSIPYMDERALKYNNICNCNHLFLLMFRISNKISMILNCLLINLF